MTLTAVAFVADLLDEQDIEPVRLSDLPGIVCGLETYEDATHIAVLGVRPVQPGEPVPTLTEAEIARLQNLGDALWDALIDGDALPEDLREVPLVVSAGSVAVIFDPDGEPDEYETTYLGATHSSELDEVWDDLEPKIDAVYEAL